MFILKTRMLPFKQLYSVHLLMLCMIISAPALHATPNCEGSKNEEKIHTHPHTHTPMVVLKKLSMLCLDLHQWTPRYLHHVSFMLGHPRHYKATNGCMLLAPPHQGFSTSRHLLHWDSPPTSPADAHHSYTSGHPPLPYSVDVR